VASIQALRAIRSATRARRASRTGPCEPSCRLSRAAGARQSRGASARPRLRRTATPITNDRTCGSGPTSLIIPQPNGMLCVSLACRPGGPFHAAYIGFVVLGFIGILAGIALGSSWVRSPGFRTAHLTAIVVVWAESIAGVACSLMALEDSLRRKVGEPAYSTDFLSRIGYTPSSSYDFQAWVFTVCWAAFGLLVAFFWLLRRVGPGGTNAEKQFASRGKSALPLWDFVDALCEK
jgi:uncharacterized protein DUF2784